jgi:NAD-dependent deacetylase
MTAVKQAAALFKQARSVLCITGAGISADSGLPTYRGIGGLYNDQRTDEGMPIEEALSGEVLRLRPDVTWKYLAQIEARCRGARFNRAHQVIAAMQERFERVVVLTQNIDGFHQAAGSRDVIDIHGNMYDLVCTQCGWRTTLNDYGGLKSIPPHCPKGHSARPDVVFFGEMLSPEKCQRLAVELRRGFDLTLSIGTTSVFPYIQQPVFEARRNSKPSIEINPSDTEVTPLVTLKLRMGAADALDAIWRTV